MVAFPRPFEPAEQLARAVAESGGLTEYVTGFVWSHDDADSIATRAAGSLLGRRAAAGLRRRSRPRLSAAAVHAFPSVDLGRTIAAALGWRGLEDRLWELDDHRFPRLAAGRLGSNDVVHGYEHASLELFRKARDRRTATVLHVSSVHPSFHDAIFDREYERHPEFKSSVSWRLRERRHRRDERRIAEYALADLIIVPSALSKRSLVENGLPSDRIETVALGASPENRAPAMQTAHAGPMRVLYAGKVSFHKGCHLLLEAWAHLSSKDAVLTLAGQNDLAAAPFAVRGTEFTGAVSQADVFQLMDSADLFVLPTLCDSFGMVITEALTRGLPVLTTANAGAADLIDEGVNGWVVPAGDLRSLHERLAWCESHVDDLRAMRPRVRASAVERTWDAHRADLRNALSRRNLL
jgi:glycosyltransferase involved in cell wall biosynthesis